MPFRVFEFENSLLDTRKRQLSEGEKWVFKLPSPKTETIFCCQHFPNVVDFLFDVNIPFWLVLSKLLNIDHFWLILGRVYFWKIFEPYGTLNQILVQTLSMIVSDSYRVSKLVAAGLRENVERMGKQWGNGERMRKWKEIHSLYFLPTFSFYFLPLYPFPISKL